MTDPVQTTKQYAEKDLEQRKAWYSPTAEAYNNIRPHYPQVVVNRVVELAQLSHDATILEIGCGPGTATVSFAELGYSMRCLEPNPDFCAIAQRNCAQYSNVEIQTTSLEEWNIEAKRFNAVLAATSIHWIPPTVAYPKIASALQDNGTLILLWNAPAILPYNVYQVLQEVYHAHAPSLSQYKRIETHEAELRKLGQSVIHSNHFRDMIFEKVVWDFTYSVDEYLSLLSTFSPYLELDEKSRNNLFEGLRYKIEETFTNGLQLSNLSAFHIAWKS